MWRLPSPAEHGLDASATIAVPVPDDGLVLYRLLEHATPNIRDFEPKLSRSQARLRHVPELFRVSISHWMEIEQAVAASSRTTCFVARLHIPADLLLRIALTEQKNAGHVDLWGHPADLLRTVGEVIHRRHER